MYILTVYFQVPAMLARSLWFSLVLASSIICFISSALGIALVVVVVLMAGLDAVAGVVAGLVIKVAVLLAGLEAEAGPVPGDVVGDCARATEAIAERTMSDFRSVFIEGDLGCGDGATSSPGCR
jgi:hypothetical protein